MDEKTKAILDFIVQMTAHLAWPVAVFTMFLAMRSQLLELVKKIRKWELEGPGGVVTRAEWGGEISDVPSIGIAEKPAD